MAYLERRCPAGPPCQQWHDPSATFVIIIITILTTKLDHHHSCHTLTHLHIIVIYFVGPFDHHQPHSNHSKPINHNQFHSLMSK